MGDEIIARDPNAVELIEGQPRVRDTALAQWLEFSEPRAIRKIIARWSRVPPGSTEPPIAPHYRDTVSRQPTNQGGSRLITINEAWLSEEEALFIAAKSETRKAVAVTKRVIAEFMRHRRELTPAVPALPAGSGSGSVPAHLVEPLEWCSTLAARTNSAQLALAVSHARATPTPEALNRVLLTLADEQTRWIKARVNQPEFFKHATTWIPTIAIAVSRLCVAIDQGATRDEQAREPGPARTGHKA
jgi:hypothetical protein